MMNWSENLLIWWQQVLRKISKYKTVFLNFDTLLWFWNYYRCSRLSFLIVVKFNISHGWIFSGHFLYYYTFIYLYRCSIYQVSLQFSWQFTSSTRFILSLSCARIGVIISDGWKVTWSASLYKLKSATVTLNYYNYFIYFSSSLSYSANIYCTK